MNDPNTAQCPNYAAAEHATMRDIMVNGGNTNDQAIEILKSLWAIGNAKDKAAWQQQMDDNVAAAANRQQL